MGEKAVRIDSAGNYRPTPGFEFEARKCLRTRTCSWCLRSSCWRIAFRSSATIRTKRSTSSAWSRTNSESFCICDSRCSSRHWRPSWSSRAGFFLESDTPFFVRDDISTSCFISTPSNPPLDEQRPSSCVVSTAAPRMSTDSLSFYLQRLPATIAAMENICTMVLAGGRGERLHPLTEHRAKPAVPFGGKYRIIDFTLSNCLNSGLRKVAVLIQYKSHSLDRHIRTGWDVYNAELGEYIASIPPQQRISEEWYRGTADAVYQNLFLLDTDQPEYVLILAGDHIYKMNYMEMFHWLIAKNADVVVGALDIPIEESKRFGIMSVDEDFAVQEFNEKPSNATHIPGDPSKAFASMGIYLFRAKSLREELIADAQENTAHDFGRNIIPRMIGSRRVYAFNFQDANKKAVKYWRDIGTLDAYWEANLDLVAVDPLFNLYDQQWPIRSEE